MIHAGKLDRIRGAQSRSETVRELIRDAWEPEYTEAVALRAGVWR